MWILTPVNIWGLRGKRSSYTKTVCRNILCLSGANACEEAISAPKTKLINFWGHGDDFLCHHILLLSPTALINPADRVLMLKWNAENVLFFLFLPASWRWWPSPCLSSPRCRAHQRLMPQQREMAPSGCQWEDWVWRETAGSPLVSVRR